MFLSLRWAYNDRTRHLDLALNGSTYTRKSKDLKQDFVLEKKKKRGNREGVETVNMENCDLEAISCNFPNHRVSE